MTLKGKKQERLFIDILFIHCNMAIKPMNEYYDSIIIENKKKKKNVPFLLDMLDDRQKVELVEYLKSHPLLSVDNNIADTLQRVIYLLSI